MFFVTPPLQIVCTSEGPLSHSVILDPSWLGGRIFGSILSPETSTTHWLQSAVGVVKLSEIQSVFPKLDPISVAHLLEQFDLCSPTSKAGMLYEFPCLLKTDTVFGHWEKNPNFQVYAGFHLKCNGESDIFSPQLLPTIQLCTHKELCLEGEEQGLNLWHDGLKCWRRKVEGRLQMLEPHRRMEVVVRGWEEAREECYALLRELYSFICHCIYLHSPGVAFTPIVLSARDLREHARPKTYSAAEVFEAAQGDGNVRRLDSNNSSDSQESVIDLVCCGSKRLLHAIKLATSVPLKAVTLLSRTRLCRLLDPPHTFGRDWCLLALQLGLTEEVPLIDQSSSDSSPTDKLLLALERADSGRTVASVIDALRAIGRDDAARLLLEDISLYPSVSSSFAFSIADVPCTSCIC